MTDIGEKIGAVIAAIVTLAVLALVFSQNANTSNVLQSFFSGLSNLIGVAISPITGQNVSGLSAGGLSGGSWTSNVGQAGYSQFASSTSNLVGSAVGGLLSGSGALVGAPSATSFIDNGTFG